MSSFGNKNDEFDVFWEDYTKRLDDELAKTCLQPTVLTPDQQETLKDLLDHYKDQLKGIRVEEEDKHNPYSALYQTGASALDWNFDNAGHEISDFFRALPESQQEQGFGRKEDGSFELVDKTYKTVNVFAQEFSKAREELRANIKPETLQEIKTWEEHGRLMNGIDMKALGVAAYKSLDFLAEQRHSQNKLQPEPAMTQTQESSGYNFHIEQPYQVTKERAAPPPPPWMHPPWALPPLAKQDTLKNDDNWAIYKPNPYPDGIRKLEGYFTAYVCDELALNDPPDDSELTRDDGIVIDKGTRIADLAAQSFARPEPTEWQQDRSAAEAAKFSWREEESAKPSATDRETKIADRLKQYQDKKIAKQEKKLTTGKGIKKKP
jgi:hypothetical protein